MSFIVPRSGIDQSPCSGRWWDRALAPIESVSLVTINGESRAQIMRSPPVPVRYLHDAAILIETSELTAPDWELDIDVTWRASARVDVDSLGRDVATEEEDTGWSVISSPYLFDLSIADTFTAEGIPSIFFPLGDRSDWDDEGTYDFVQMLVTVQTVADWVGTVAINVTLYGNWKMWHMQPGLPVASSTQPYLDLNQQIYTPNL